MLSPPVISERIPFDPRYHLTRWRGRSGAGLPSENGGDADGRSRNRSSVWRGHRSTLAVVPQHRTG
jgi:hypothetical protein